ncbi:MAG TPA: AMP-binding protein [Blastocatellia bacterium]|nr:AMP-binding protein [Blastocatellia bacterium]
MGEGTTDTMQMNSSGYRPSRPAAVAAEGRVHSLIDLLNLRAAAEPSQIAYTTIDDQANEALSVTYQELHERASTIGAYLQRVNAAGSRAILLYPAGLDYIAAFFGCLKGGVVPVPAFPPRPNRRNERLEAIVLDATPTLALTT